MQFGLKSIALQTEVGSMVSSSHAVLGIESKKSRQARKSTVYQIISVDQTIRYELDIEK